MARRVLASNFDADRRGMVVQIRDKNLAYEAVEMLIFFRDSSQSVRDGPDNAVSKENAQKGANQRATDEFAEDFGRLVDGTHRFDNAEHCGHNAQRRQAISDDLKRMAGVLTVVKMRFETLFEHIFDLMRVVVIHRGRPQRIADHFDGFMILLDFWVGAENR